MAVYRVTLPSGGLRGKWAGRPPPPAPEDLYTGPRSDELLSTEDISGEYSAPGCSECQICRSLTVVPLGADAIETWRSGCMFCPPLFCGPSVWGDVRTRKPGTNDFDWVTFSADGTASVGYKGDYKKRPNSQKRAFQKVDARDLAGDWLGCVCIPVTWPLSAMLCTTRKALNEDQYEVSGRCCFLLTMCLPLIPCSGTRTRKYVNGHPTDAFAKDGSSHHLDVLWYRDPGCAVSGGNFVTKVG